MVGMQLSRQSSKSTKQKQENLVEHMKHLGAGWGIYSTKTTNARWLHWKANPEGGGGGGGSWGRD